MVDVKLRQARADDIAAMHRVRLAVRENRLTSLTLGEAHYQEAIEDTGRGWVIDSAGQVCAFAIGNARSGNIWALFVHPAHERQGLGRWLHDAMVDWLFAQGLQRLWLSTGQHTRAESFYLRAGWRCTGVLADGELGFELHRDEWAARR